MHSPSLLARHRGELATETKFVVDRAMADEIRQWARRNLNADAHGTGPHGDTYAITTLYLDTPNLDILQRSGSYGSKKYRLRRYADSDVIYLERKVKSEGRVTKRRTAVPVEEIGRLGGEELRLSWPGYWFHRRVLLRRLQPVCELSYQRIARTAVVEGGTVRLTLDESIRARVVSDYGFLPEGLGSVPLLDDRVIVEMKYLSARPQLFCELVQEFQLSAEPASKYRRAGALLLQAAGAHA